MHFSIPSLLIASVVSASGMKTVVKRAPSAQVCAAAPSAGQGAVINLGLASNYAILAKTGIADSVPGTAVNHIFGNIGVAPIAMTAITGFALTGVSASDDSASSVYVSGQAHGPAHNLGSGTTGDAATDMLAAYNCAKGYPALPANSVAAAGSLDGRTFAPGVYKWSGAVSLGVGAKVYLQGKLGDVFIFNAAGAFSTGASSEVVLSGGVTPATVYWVGSTVLTTGDKSIFRGMILTGTNVVIAGYLYGAVLAQTEVALDTATIISPCIINDTGRPNDGTGSCAGCTSTDFAMYGSNCRTKASYARWAGLDCDQEPLNKFYGSTPTWVVPADLTNQPFTSGNQLQADKTDATGLFINLDASEGSCEAICQLLFPNPKNVAGGYQGFVYVPYTSHMKNDLKIGAYSAMQCYCKRDSADAVLSQVPDRSCNMAGSCEQFKAMTSKYNTDASTSGNSVKAYCQDVSYTATTCITNDPTHGNQCIVSPV